MIYEDAGFVYQVFLTVNGNDIHPDNLKKVGECDIITAEEHAYSCKQKGIDPVWIYPQDRPVYPEIVRSIKNGN